MLRLLLLRHSKAVPFTGSGDHQRALTERGRADAARLGSYILDEKIVPVAHNPTIAEMASRLTGTGEPAAMIGLAGKFPTSALAVIDFDVDHWSEIDEGKGRLIAFATPASLGEREE
jgi:phosphohistidine phosphatase SixA